MKVSELIAVLQSLPQDEEILIQGQYDDLYGGCDYGNSVQIQYERFIRSAIKSKKTGELVIVEDHAHRNYAGRGENCENVYKLVLSETYAEPYINLDKPNKT